MVIYWFHLCNLPIIIRVDGILRFHYGEIVCRVIAWSTRCNVILFLLNIPSSLFQFIRSKAPS
jgi:hypothetical protein